MDYIKTASYHYTKNNKNIQIFDAPANLSNDFKSIGGRYYSKKKMWSFSASILNEDREEENNLQNNPKKYEDVTIDSNSDEIEVYEEVIKEYDDMEEEDVHEDVAAIDEVDDVDAMEEDIAVHEDVAAIDEVDDVDAMEEDIAVHEDVAAIDEVDDVDAMEEDIAVHEDVAAIDEVDDVDAMEEDIAVHEDVAAIDEVDDVDAMEDDKTEICLMEEDEDVNNDFAAIVDVDAMEEDEMNIVITIDDAIDGVVNDAVNVEECFDEVIELDCVIDDNIVINVDDTMNSEFEYNTIDQHNDHYLININDESDNDSVVDNSVVDTYDKNKHRTSNSVHETDLISKEDVMYLNQKLAISSNKYKIYPSKHFYDIISHYKELVQLKEK
jgi:hypothetical protein